MIRSLPGSTRIEVFRDDRKVLETMANIQENIIFFDNVDIKELDIIKVPSASIEFKIMNIYSQLMGNMVLYKKATVIKISG